MDNASTTRRRGPRTVKPEPNPTFEEDDEDLSSIEGGDPDAAASSSSNNGLPGGQDRGLCGLRNYGNTCFLNSNVQALAACTPLCEYLRRLTSPLPLERGRGRSGSSGRHSRSSRDDSSSDRQTSKLSRPFDQRSPLASALGQTLRDMWAPSEGRSLTTGPGGVLSELGKINPMFESRDQQDAHEALRCLLDGMHEQLKVPVPQEFEPGWQPPEPEEEDTDQSQKSSAPQRRERYEHSVVADLFHGCLRNQVTCLECGHRSSTREVCYDISLSLTREVQRQIRTHRRRASPPPNPQPEAVGLVGGTSQQLEDNYSNDSQNDTRKPRAPSPKSAIVRKSPCRSTTNLLGKLSAPLTEWLGWGPSVALEDLLHHFCTSERMVGANQYHCDKCKKLVDAEKTVSLASLPEVLVIHLKRFRHNGNIFGNSKVSTKIQFPLEGLDLSPFQSASGDGPVRPPRSGGRSFSESRADSGATGEPLASYRLLALIQHHGMSVNGGHYTAICRNRLSGQWYEYSDEVISLVDEEAVARKEPYILFYQKIKDPASFQEDESSLEAMSQTAKPPFVGLPLWWYLKWKYCSFPGPLCAYEQVCPHGRLKPYKGPYNSRHFISLSTEAFEYLQKKFGPFPEWESTNSTRRWVESIEAVEAEEHEKDMIFREYHKCTARSLDRKLVEAETCLECTAVHKAWAAYLRKVKEEVQRRDAKESQESPEELYLIDSIWLQNWQKYITSDPRQDLDDPFEQPGPISNHRLVDTKTMVPLPKKFRTKHYRAVNSQVWTYLQSVHGGGPPIRRQTADLYEEENKNKEEAQAT